MSKKKEMVSVEEGRKESVGLKDLDMSSMDFQDDIFNSSASYSDEEEEFWAHYGF